MKRRYKIKLYKCENYSTNVDKYMLAKRYSYKVVELISFKFNYELVPIATFIVIIAFATYLQM